MLYFTTLYVVEARAHPSVRASLHVLLFEGQGACQSSLAGPGSGWLPDAPKQLLPSSGRACPGLKIDSPGALALLPQLRLAEGDTSMTT